MSVEIVLASAYLAGLVVFVLTAIRKRKALRALYLDNTGIYANDGWVLFGATLSVTLSTVFWPVTCAVTWIGDYYRG